MQTSKVRPEPTIPDHEVLRKIGGGAYGEVWLAQGVTGAMRAVKTVWHNDFDDERGFEREFEGILRYEPISRDHPGLVHILHVGRSEVEGEPFYYYVMELGDDVVTGRDINPVEYEPRTLRSDMKSAEGRMLDIEECITSGRLLAEGLEHLHLNGLAHRDVKPSNVIFVDGKAKLADIGLVAQRGQQTFVGTEGFVPPEGPGSAQADVYSLGKVLYEMATGKDRLDFPELPDELPEGARLRRWRLLNSVICDVCEPKISRRKIKTAGDLASELAHLEAGRRRPLRVRRGLVGAGLGGALGLVAATQIFTWKSVEIPSAPPAPVPVVEKKFSRVTVTSYPTGATVYDSNANDIGTTPLDPKEFEVGETLWYTLELAGFRRELVEVTVPDKKSFIIDRTLKIYNPPREGEPWEDVLEISYKPVGDHHISNYYIGETEWNQYREETGHKGGQIVELTEAGMPHRVVLATKKEADRFIEWLTEKCGDSYLDEDNWMEAKMDRSRELGEIDPQLVQKGLRPFYSAVFREPKATVKITTEPLGATVYLNGVAVGEATGPEPLIAEIKIGTGKVELIVEAKGYKQFKQILQLKPDDVWAEPLHIELDRENVFQGQMVNSLGMEFVPVGEGLDLLACIWETRVKDYAAFVDGHEKFLKEFAAYAKKNKDYEQAYQEYAEATKGRVKSPPDPGFEQGPDHPVVNVTREDAELFCRWLTFRERMAKGIAPNHEYRLPTDLEWSLLAGREGEDGEWPFERHGQGGGFPWGDEIAWPPPIGAGNFWDAFAFEREEAANPRYIQGYHDGFERTAPVGSFSKNALGLYDIAGNVHEWVSDDYTAQGDYHVARGGGWNNSQATHLRTSARTPVSKEADPSSYYGFRVVLAKAPVISEKEPADEVSSP